MHCVGFFFGVNDKKKVGNKNHQLMYVFLFEVVEAFNKRTKPRKRLISYYKTNVITLLKNHVDAKHVVSTTKI